MTEMTEEMKDDILTFKLNEMDIDEFSVDNNSEFAIPFKCWGRGCKRPDISELNIPNFLKTINKESYLPHELDNSESSRLLFSKPVKNDLMENIRSQCDSVIGNQISEQDIIDALKTDTEREYKDEDPSISNKHNVNDNIKCHFIEKQNSLESKTKSEKFEKIPTDDSSKSQKDFKIKFKKERKSKCNNNFEDSMSSNYSCKSDISCTDSLEYDNSDDKTDIPSCKDKHNLSNSISVVKELKDKEKNCIILKNIPSDLNEHELKKFLCGFGTIESMQMGKIKEEIYVIIKMANEGECKNLIECLDGIYVFETASLPLQVYFQ